MPLLQVRDCPEDLYKKITSYAKKNNRTIAQQIITTLEKGLEIEIPNKERRKNLLNKIESRNINPKTLEIDDVKLIREDRDR